MPYLKAENLTFSYGEETIFQNFTLSVSEGERVALKGRSGIGKSTLFKLILGFERPQSGTLYFRDEPIAGSRIRHIRGETAWLPQDLNMGNGAVRDVIERPLNFRRNRERQPNKEALHSLMDSLGLTSALLTKSWAQLSTGQRQRMGIVVCLLLNKPLLLLDEPTSALDRTSREKLRDLLFADRKRTILSTSHDDFWLKLCDRTIDLDQKRIQP
ncbi:MAG: ATP-binding cassette domain-containing protein [Balneolaceae bacterium]